MEGETKKTIKYLMNQPATVHNYGKLNKSENPRSHSSPTSILRKFPHSLRHDQKHQTKIKRNSSPINIIISGVSAAAAAAAVAKHEQEVNRKSWSFGDDISEEERPSSDESPKCQGLYPANDAYPTRKLSNTSVSSEVSSDGDVWKLQSTIVNKNDSMSVQELNDKSEKRSSITKNSYASIDKLSLQGEESIKEPIKKLSVINNAFNECIGIRSKSVHKMTELNSENQFPIHKSTPNLLHCSISSSERMSDRSSDESDSSQEKPRARRCGAGSNGRQLPLRGSDSLPHLDQRHRIINSILPRISRTISERPESVISNGRKSNLAKACIKSESHINSQNLYNNGLHTGEPYFSLTNILDIDRKSDIDRSDDDNEGLTLIDNHRSVIVRSGKDQKEGRGRWSNKKTVDIMPTLRNLMGKRNKCDGRYDDVNCTGASAPLVTSPYLRTESFSSLNIPQIKYFDANDENVPVKKCETVYALTSLLRSDSSFCVEPMKPVNRLRVPPNGLSGSTSRMCSRCSSLLSMASSSRYSINTTGSGFVNCSQPAERHPEPNLLCKLCLMEVPVSMSLKIDSCGCVFCKDCMRLYVEFEIQEGAYDISCPDAQCRGQGIVSTDEVETLVMPRMMERYRRFRLNHEVDMDRNRTWCPRAGCETVCEICPREKCAPMSVHCPTCDSDFCSNCKNAWHKGLTCEENSKKLAKEGRADFMEPGIPFDSDSIKCCPMCNVPIEKDEGCAQMMCKRCKHVFCWYCLASLDDDFLLRHYDKGPCKNKLGHTRASVIWHRTQVIGIFAGLGLLLLVASPLLLLAAPCIVCCKCRVCSGNKLDAEDDLPEDSGT